MKREFAEYLASIGISTALRERIEAIQLVCAKICPEEIVDIFVNEYITEDGTRHYQGLDLFSRHYLISVNQFVTTDDLHIAPLYKKILSFEVSKQEYDFDKATEKSRLYLKFHTTTKGEGEFKASKENCTYLTKIMRKYIIPNIALA